MVLTVITYSVSASANRNGDDNNNIVHNKNTDTSGGLIRPTLKYHYY